MSVQKILKGFLITAALVTWDTGARAGDAKPKSKGIGAAWEKKMQDQQEEKAKAEADRQNKTNSENKAKVGDKPKSKGDVWAEKIKAQQKEKAEADWQSKQEEMDKKNKKIISEKGEYDAKNALGSLSSSDRVEKEARDRLYDMEGEIKQGKDAKLKELSESKAKN